MRILLDECIPRKLKRYLIGHDCTTVSEAGWVGRRNGELLKLAEADGYGVFLTLDKGIRYQQNLSAFRIPVIILNAKSNRLEDLIKRVPACLETLSRIRDGQVIRV